MNSSSSLQLMGWLIFVGFYFIGFSFLHVVSHSPAGCLGFLHTMVQEFQRIWIWAVFKMLAISDLLESQCMIKPQALVWEDYGPRDLYRLQIVRQKMRGFHVFIWALLLQHSLTHCDWCSSWISLRHSKPAWPSFFDMLLVLQTAKNNYVIMHTTTFRISL